MNIKELNNKQINSTDTKQSKIYAQFGGLLSELKKREAPENIGKSINEYVDEINSSPLTGNQLTKLLKQKQTEILKQIEKELKVVPKNHYRTLWMLFGMSGIGLPIGVAFGLSIGNIGLLGLGLPIGMIIGLAIGASLDKKALNEGRQLNIEIKN
ncbi:hypothetical protein EZ428_16650 [Pedobacter frigiditerrae]|uniref:Uncharacterized protein n=1 Tax=Pedobacter frigiditerrae TaxID=2530452 RepID=A0A4R0MTQ5_9SPHI|nr:hypothetical protein [Pedobacter frigiditerrae]TCC89324.1 hypothetical protein EZ428_16650 [Pedobacter frigiditerrae]